MKKEDLSTWAQQLMNNPNELDDIIDEWHDNDVDASLHDYIGVTWEEYQFLISERTKREA